MRHLIICFPVLFFLSTDYAADALAIADMSGNGTLQSASTPLAVTSPEPLAGSSESFKNSAATSAMKLDLSSIINKGMLGIDFEKMSATTRAELRTQAEEYIKFRRGRMPLKQKMLWLADCLAHPAGDAYCSFLLEKKTSRSADQDRGEGLAIARIIGHLQHKDVAAFKGISLPQINKALKGFGSWNRLEGITDAALAASDCAAPVPLLTALGQKAEEFLPDQRFRSLATSLYSRASSCGQDLDETAEKARFRGGLLNIWAGNCKDAEPLFAKLVLRKDGDYISRALYWRAQCAEMSGDKMLYNAMKNRLINEFPLSFHGILLNGKRRSVSSRIIGSQENLVNFRSVTHPELNEIARAAEMLISLRSGDLAAELLSFEEGRFEKAEVPFRLYIAALLKRFGEPIPQFRFLNDIFRDEPAVISRATLEMFYPLRRLDVLKRYGSRLDPYLVAAVIRQESGFNERARSPAGAVGLMQLMPRTARRMERVSRRELMDAKTNVRLGVKFFSKLLDRYDADAELSLAAYNAGPERVDEWKHRYAVSDRVLFLDLIPYSETRNYVALISRNYYWYLSLYTDENYIRKPYTGYQKKKPVVFTMFRS